MTEGTDDFSAGPPPPPRSASPTSSAVDSGPVPEEKPEEKQEETEEAEEEVAGQSGEEAAEGGAEGGADDGEHVGAVGIMALSGGCCVCVEMERVRNCVHSEKICILPIVACLLSLALCTAGLKWVFVDKIFEYEPPTHLDPKRIGQDPIVISADPTLGLFNPHASPSPSSVTSPPTITTLSPAVLPEHPPVTPGHPDVFLEEKSTWGPKGPPDPSLTLKYNAERPTTTTEQTPHYPRTTQQITENAIPTISATSTTTKAKTSSHVTRCTDRQRNYCVNGGECFTLEIMPGSTKFLCRCPNEFTGDRCQNYVMASIYKAEEMYQKRILTISGICIALLVVGIMCVVAYYKTKKQRKKLQDRLRQSLRTKKKKKKQINSGAKQQNSVRGRHEANIGNMPLQELQPQCNGTVTRHAAENDTETTFTSKNAFSAHDHTTFTNVSSQSWNNDWSDSLSDNESVSVTSLTENSQRAPQRGRGRLNATAGTRDLRAHSKKGRDTDSSDMA